MNIYLDISDSAYRALLSHLFPWDTKSEQAAFFFAKFIAGDGLQVFEVADTYFAGPDDFDKQHNDYLTLSDITRQKLIKRAYKSDSCLVESHSHLGVWPAAFSAMDLVELRETVRHMWWRLKKRPYLALVFTRAGFDALAWTDNPARPQVLSSIRVGPRRIEPTQISIRSW